MADGLSQYSVQSLLQDSRGFIWLGTQDGLNRFDGYSFKIYKHDPYNNKSLSANSIKAIVEDNDQQLWVGTDHGLNKYNNLNGEFERIALPNENGDLTYDQRIESIIQDQDGIIWVGTYSGLFAISLPTQTIKFFFHENNNETSLSSNSVTSIFEDSKGSIWVGTLKGLNNFDKYKNTFIRIYKKDGLSSDHITSFTEDENKNIWIGTYYAGITKYNLDSAKFTYLPISTENANKVKSDRINTLYKDKNKTIWIGTYSGASQYLPEDDLLLHYNPNNLNPDSIVGHDVRAILEDGSGVFWLGMAGGASYFDMIGKGFSHIKHIVNDPNSLIDNSIRTIYQDSEGNIWVGTKKGITAIDRQNKNYSHYLKSKNLNISNNLTVIHEDKQGVMWFGTYDEGIYLYDHKKKIIGNLRHKPNDINSIPHDKIRELFQDSQNNIWIGTQQGIAKYIPSTGTFVRYQHQPSNNKSLGHNRIYDIYEDKKKRIWVGTRGGGLHLFNPVSNNFTRYQHDSKNPRSLSHNRVYSIDEDDNGFIWVSTKGGLNKLDPSTGVFKHYRERDGLPNDTTNAVIVDKNNQVWVSTNLGLSKLNPEDDKFIHFNVNDGLQSNEFNTHAFYKAESGELFFGGVNGITAFFPKNIKKNTVLARPTLTDFLIFNQSVFNQQNRHRITRTANTNELNHIQLNYTESMFSIGFSGLHYANPSSNKFRYKLAGYDDRWIKSDAQKRFATYTNLPAGHYQFELMASNNNNIWSAPQEILSIDILPAPWNTWWAYCLYILLIIVILSIFLAQHIKKLQERNISFQKIKHQKEQLKLALWASGDELWDIDLTNNSITRLNQARYINRNENMHWQLNNNDSLHIHPDDIKLIEQAQLQHFSQEKPFYEAVYRVKTNSDDWIWVIDKGKIVARDAQGQATRFTGTTQNINKLKATEEELQLLNEELEHRVTLRTKELKLAQRKLIQSEKMASLGNLVIGVAHEINTPLGVAITSLSILNDSSQYAFGQIENGSFKLKDFEKFANESNASIDLLTSNLNRIANLVNDFKKISVDNNAESKHEIIFPKVIHNLLIKPHFSSLFDQGSIVLDCTHEVKIVSYPNSLLWILEQIINNSLKHGYNDADNIDGNFSILINIKKNNKGVIIQIKDTGMGMDKNTSKKIFDPFFTTNRGEHTGLGMNIVFNKVHQLLKGKIYCTSEVGQGTVIKLHIPSITLKNETISINSTD